MASPDSTEELRQCNGCQETKPLLAFGLSNGYRRWLCRMCKQQQDAAYRLAHREEKRARDRAYHAANRQHRLASFRRYYATHKEEYAAYCLAHADQLKAKMKAYHAKNHARDYARLKSIPGRLLMYWHTREARKAQSPVNDLSAAQWREIKEAQGFRCAYCGVKFPSNLLTPDHITPYAHQGSNTLWNVVACCQPCNARKNTRAPLVPVQPLLLSVAPKKRTKS